MKNRISSILTACLIITATAAFGYNKAEQFSISPVIGGYTFEGKQHLDTNLIYGVRAGYNFTDNFGVEALFDYVNTQPTKATNKVELYRYGGELLYHFIPENTFVPYLAVGIAGLNLDAPGGDKKARAAVDYGLGAKYFVSENFALRGDIRHIIYSYNAQTKNNLEYTLGAYIPFGGAKPASKPVEPPPTPAPAPAPKAVEPAPAPQAVPPTAPTAALMVSPDKITKGQISTLNWKSQNASGCDIQPGIGPVPPQGARIITPTASTSYSITCSGTSGTAGSAAGITVVEMPKTTAAAVRFCNKPAILKINFDTNKSDIKPQYHNELKTVGDFLKEFPKAKGEISGHTDSVGSNTFNQKLSERRAESVAKYIETTFAIEPGRITTKGYGETKPIASNKTKAGKTKNRRIEANFTCE